MEGDKRGITDYNGEMRRGGRGGGGYRMPGSKDMGPVEMGPYGEKVRSCCANQYFTFTELPFSTLAPILYYFTFFFLYQQYLLCGAGVLT